MATRRLLNVTVKCVKVDVGSFDQYAPSRFSVTCGI